MKRIGLVVFLLAGFSSPGQPQEIPVLDSISQGRLMETVTFLAGPGLAGRLSGSPGYEKAAAFMAGEFGKIGLKPLGDTAYYQELTVEYNDITGPVHLLRRRPGQPGKEYTLGRDFVCRGFTGSGHVTAPVVFCGYGLSRPEAGYDDYAGIDIQGKIAMAFKPNPSWKPQKGDWGSGAIRVKAAEAARHGARAILFVSLPMDKNPQKPIMSVLHGEGIQDEAFPQLHIDLGPAGDFFEESGATLLELQTLIDSLKVPASRVLPWEAEVEVHAVYEKAKKTQNVIGLLEGSDPVLRSEYVVVGAHLDHVGSQAHLLYAPGANDNASGSAAVLQMARAFTSSVLSPKRSIIFALFASEEQGLFGASRFAERPPIPAERITAMVNMDCIGFGDSIQVGNGKSSPVLWSLAQSLDSTGDRLMVEATWNGGGADAGPFHQKGIPAAYFVTTNSYGHLHLAEDTPATLNGPLFEKIVRLASRTVGRVADGGYTRETVKP